MIYYHIILPLTCHWGHPYILSKIRNMTIAFTPEVKSNCLYDFQLIYKLHPGFSQ